MSGHRGTVARRGPNTWQVRLRVGGGRRITRTVHGTRADAERLLASLVLTETTPEVADGWSVTVAELLERWLEWRSTRLAPTVVADYRGVIDRHLVPALGERRVRDVRPADLDLLYARLASSGLSSARIRRVHNVASAAFGQAVRWGWVREAPTTHASPPPVRSAPTAVPSAAELTAILAACDHPGLAEALRLVAVTGMRRGEIVALRWSDIDLEAATVTVARSGTIAGGRFVEGPTKTHALRVVSLDAGTVEVLEAWRSRQHGRARTLGVALVDDPRVFSDDITGERHWHPNSLSRRFRRTCERAGVHGVRLHDLRHFAATQALVAGVDVKTVSKRLGHARASMTLDRYAHLVTAADRAAADALGRVVDGG